MQCNKAFFVKAMQKTVPSHWSQITHKAPSCHGGHSQPPLEASETTSQVFPKASLQPSVDFCQQRSQPHGQSPSRHAWPSLADMLGNRDIWISKNQVTNLIDIQSSRESIILSQTQHPIHFHKDDFFLAAVEMKWFL